MPCDTRRPRGWTIAVICNDRRIVRHGDRRRHRTGRRLDAARTLWIARFGGARAAAGRHVSTSASRNGRGVCLTAHIPLGNPGVIRVLLVDEHAVVRMGFRLPPAVHRGNIR